MFKSFNDDIPYLENKYHDINKPFNPYNRMAYHGYEYPKDTGLSDDEIIEGLKKLEKETKELHHSIAKAKAIKYVLDNTRIDINKHDYFIGLNSWNRLINQSTISKWKKEVFNEIMPEVNNLMKDLNNSGAISIWPDFDHVVPDWESIMKLGFNGILERAKSYKEIHKKNNTLTPDMEAYFDSIEIVYSSIIDFIDRLYKYAILQNHDKSKEIAKCLKSIRDGAPQNFYEALQTIYIYFMISESIDCYQVRSLGNGLDNTLYKFYMNDLINGTFTHEQIKEFLAYFFIQWSSIGNYWGQPFYLGGSDENGNSKINNLTYDIIDVYNELNIYNPKIQIKVSSNTPKDFLYKIFDMIRNGKNSINFCCEPGIIKAVMGYGATYEEALNIDIRGCYETGVRANEVSTVTGYINALKPVLYALYNGYDTTINKQIGINTGDIETLTTFDDFLCAVIRQWDNLIEQTIYAANNYEKYLSYINPSIMYSATIENSLIKGKDAYQNGVKYNNSAILNCGFASMIDSIMAIKEFVYDKKEISLKELRNALDSNWQDYEILRLKILNSKNKYGNDNKETDMYAKVLSKWFCNKVNNRDNARGGVYKAILHSAMQFIRQGEKTQATPDGRKYGDEISKNGSPSIGMDKEGITALINSVVKLEPYLYHEAFALDVMLLKDMVSSDKGLIIMDALLQTYIQNDGMSIQFNVFDIDILKDAQINPNKYKNLQVRVCGWNVLWNNLSKKEQDAYIERAISIQNGNSKTLLKKL